MDLLSDIQNTAPETPVDDIDVNPLEAQEILKARLKNHRYEANTKARSWMANWSAAVVSIWLLWVLVILMFNHECIHLADSVLDVLLATTTLNVLGLALIVLKGYFNDHETPS